MKRVRHTIEDEAPRTMFAGQKPEGIFTSFELVPFDEDVVIDHDPCGRVGTGMPDRVPWYELAEECSPSRDGPAIRDGDVRERDGLRDTSALTERIALCGERRAQSDAQGELSKGRSGDRHGHE